MVMDAIAVSEEVARESLMKISCSLPRKLLNLDNVPQNFDRDDSILVGNGDGDEKYSSYYISISYIQPPDVTFVPMHCITETIWVCESYNLMEEFL